MPQGPEGETPRFIDEGSESDYRGGLGEGHAVFIFNDGKKYTGMWVDNEQQGYGVMEYPDKDGPVTYVGEWHKGKQHGKGKYTWGCGSVYDGDWKEGLKHGKGKFMMSSGNVYEGDFVEGRWEGWGKYTIVQVCFRLACRAGPTRAQASVPALLQAASSDAHGRRCTSRLLLPSTVRPSRALLLLPHAEERDAGRVQRRVAGESAQGRRQVSLLE